MFKKPTYGLFSQREVTWDKEHQSQFSLISTLVFHLCPLGSHVKTRSDTGTRSPRTVRTLSRTFFFLCTVESRTQLRHFQKKVSSDDGQQDELRDFGSLIVHCRRQQYC